MKRLALIALALSVILLGCQKVEYTKSSSFSLDNKMSVGTTIGMIGDVAANIGGERVAVYSMMEAEVNPHLYKAKAGDLTRLNKSDIILYNGIHLESKLGDVMKKLSKTQNTLILFSC